MIHKNRKARTIAAPQASLAFVSLIITVSPQIESCMIFVAATRMSVSGAMYFVKSCEPKMTLPVQVLLYR